ncbi:MAG: hypothetical protein JST01_08975, partial [Cyanobacteria bacterium SZAS TMP-1]|nr:hypothetical protein [Cyanobacteria bacterium SZAS TMP-1]
MAALRQLAFEEPVSRLARLKKTVQRQLARAERDRVRDLSLLQLAALHGEIFGSAAGGDKSALLSLLFSLALALEDLRIYSSTAFSPIPSIAPADEKSDLLAPAAKDLIVVADKISALLELGPERRAWLTVSLLASVDWVAACSWARGESSWPEAVTEILSAENLSAENLNIDCLSLADLADSDCRRFLAAAEEVALRLRHGFRPSLVVLVEGQSELIVLPHFARLCGRPLEAMGAHVIASGGAKQVARRYLTMKDV